MSPLSVSDLQTLGGATIVVALIVEIVKRAVAWTPATVDRFGPLVAAFLGIALVVSVGAYEHADLAQSALTGLLAGASAMGLSDAAGTVAGSAAKASNGAPPIG